MAHERSLHWRDVKFQIGYQVVWDSSSAIALMLTPDVIEQLSDTEIVELCRWFQEHSTEIDTIESVRECPGYRHDEDDLVIIANMTNSDFLREDALWILQALQEQKLAAAEVTTTTQRARPKTHPGYVYIVEGDGYYKIGRTNNVDKRLTKLSTQPPFNLEIICVIETDNMHALEAELHETFADKHVRGEWFSLGEEDIEWLLVTYKETIRET